MLNNISKQLTKFRIFFKTVFGSFSYIFLAVTVGLIFLIISIWLANYNFLYHTLNSNLLNYSFKFKSLFNFADLIMINIKTSTLYITIVIAFLFGINISALVYYIKKQIEISRGIKSSIWVSLISLLGIGCLSCGSVVISSIFGFTATAAFIGLLPFKGCEFGVIGIASLVVSIYLLANKISNNFVCKV